MTLDALERLAREAKGLAEAAMPRPWTAKGAHTSYALEDANAALAAASRTLVPSLADAVLRLVAVARAASEFYRVTTFCPDTHDCPSREQLNAALSALAKSEGGG